MLRRLNYFMPTNIDAADENQEGLQKQIEEYLVSSFDLDDFGRNGITLRAQEEEQRPAMDSKMMRGREAEPR